MITIEILHIPMTMNCIYGSVVDCTIFNINVVVTSTEASASVFPN